MKKNLFSNLGTDVSKPDLEFHSSVDLLYRLASASKIHKKVKLQGESQYTSNESSYISTARTQPRVGTPAVKDHSVNFRNYRKQKLTPKSLQPATQSQKVQQSPQSLQSLQSDQAQPTQPTQPSLQSAPIPHATLCESALNVPASCLIEPTVSQAQAMVLNQIYKVQTQSNDQPNSQVKIQPQSQAQRKAKPWDIASGANNGAVAELKPDLMQDAALGLDLSAKAAQETHAPTLDLNSNSIQDTGHLPDQTAALVQAKALGQTKNQALSLEKTQAFTPEPAQAKPKAHLQPQTKGTQTKGNAQTKMHTQLKADTQFYSPVLALSQAQVTNQTQSQFLAQAQSLALNQPKQEQPSALAHTNTSAQMHEQEQSLTTDKSLVQGLGQGLDLTNAPASLSQPPVKDKPLTQSQLQAQNHSPVPAQALAADLSGLNADSVDSWAMAQSIAGYKIGNSPEQAFYAQKPQTPEVTPLVTNTHVHNRVSAKERAQAIAYLWDNANTNTSTGVNGITQACANVRSSAGDISAANVSIAANAHAMDKENATASAMLSTLESLYSRNTLATVQSLNSALFKLTPDSLELLERIHTESNLSRLSYNTYSALINCIGVLDTPLSYAVTQVDARLAGPLDNLTPLHLAKLLSNVEHHNTCSILQACGLPQHTPLPANLATPYISQPKWDSAQIKSRYTPKKQRLTSGTVSITLKMSPGMGRPSSAEKYTDKFQYLALQLENPAPPMEGLVDVHAQFAHPAVDLTPEQRLAQIKKTELWIGIHFDLLNDLSSQPGGTTMFYELVNVLMLRLADNYRYLAELLHGAADLIDQASTLWFNVSVNYRNFPDLAKQSNPLWASLAASWLLYYNRPWLLLSHAQEDLTEDLSSASGLAQAPITTSASNSNAVSDSASALSASTSTTAYVSASASDAAQVTATVQASIQNLDSASANMRINDLVHKQLSFPEFEQDFITRLDTFWNRLDALAPTWQERLQNVDEIDLTPEMLRKLLDKQHS